MAAAATVVAARMAAVSTATVATTNPVATEVAAISNATRHGMTSQAPAPSDDGTR